MSSRTNISNPVLLTAVLVFLLAVSGCGKKTDTTAAQSKDVKGITGQASLTEIPPSGHGHR